MKRIGLVLLISAVTAGAAAAAVATKSPKALRAAILAAGRAQQSVHWVQKVRDPASLTTITSDVATTEGAQKVTLKVGTHTAHLTIELVDQTAYVEGDAAGLVLLQGLTPTQAQKYANQWISVPKGDADYSGNAAGLTVSSILAGVFPNTHLTPFAGKLHGKRVVGVRSVSGKGKKQVISLLYAPATGKPLPLEVDDSAPAHKGFSEKTIFSKWNETVNVTAPASSTPIATVRQS